MAPSTSYHRSRSPKPPSAAPRAHFLARSLSPRAFACAVAARDGSSGAFESPPFPLQVIGRREACQMVRQSIPPPASPLLPAPIPSALLPSTPHRTHTDCGRRGRISPLAAAFSRRLWSYELPLAAKPTYTSSCARLCAACVQCVTLWPVVSHRRRVDAVVWPVWHVLTAWVRRYSHVTRLA